jgi:hypothetical protein
MNEDAIGQLLERIDRLIEVMTAVAESNAQLTAIILAGSADEEPAAPPRTMTTMDGKTFELPAWSPACRAARQSIVPEVPNPRLNEEPSSTRAGEARPNADTTPAGDVSGKSISPRNRCAGSASRKAP